MRDMKFAGGVKAVFFVILTLALCCGFANAQSNSYANMLNTTMVASQSLFTAQTAVNKQRESMAQAAGVTDYSYERQPAKQYPITATDIRPLSPPIIPGQFADSATGVDAATRETMRQFFQQTLTSFESQARKNNLANAFTWISEAALKVKNGKQLSDPEEARLIAYFNNTLAASPSYYTINPRQQQMLYESLIITGGIIVFLDDQGKQTNNRELQKQAKEMSSAVLKNFLGINN
ncbi:MAG: DUF6683 family protein [Candidatus Binatia bacterium]